MYKSRVAGTQHIPRLAPIEPAVTVPARDAVPCASNPTRTMLSGVVEQVAAVTLGTQSSSSMNRISATVVMPATTAEPLAVGVPRGERNLKIPPVDRSATNSSPAELIAIPAAVDWAPDPPGAVTVMVSFNTGSTPGRSA